MKKLKLASIAASLLLPFMVLAVGGAEWNQIGAEYRAASAIVTDICTFDGGSCTAIGGGATPGGADTQVQYNDGGVLGAEAGFTYVKGTDTLSAVNMSISGAASINTAVFDAISAPAHSAGTLFYDTTDDELAFYDSISGTKLNIGSEMRTKVRNSSGVAIADFTPVYSTGALGNRATIDLAKADAEATSMVIAVTTNLIGNNSDGSATTAGTINEVDTDGSPYGETWLDGQEIFLSAATAGALTNVPPTGNNLTVSIGKVRVAANNGSFEVKIDGANVRGATSVTDNSIVRFDGTSGKRIKESSAISASEISIATGVGTPTVDQIQEYLDNTGSSGFFLGGALSDGGAGTLDVAAGSGFIRTTNDDNAELQSFKWSASLGIAVTDNTTQYVYVDDAGTITLTTDEFLEAPDKIQIGVVTKEGGAVEHVFALGVRLQESIAEAGRFIRRVHGISRDKRNGGLIMGQSGDANRDVSMTAGSLWWGRTEYAIGNFDTSGADTFQTYSAGGQENAVASQFPNTQYDNAGTLTTMNNNRWANLFFFLEPDDHVVMVYGRAEFNSQALAEQEGVPSSSLPTKVTETSILVSRYTFQESTNTAVISSAFEDLFANAGVTDHGNLAGLADDDHTQYGLLIGRSGGSTYIGGIDASDDITFQTTSNASKGDYIFSELTTNGFMKTTGAAGIVGVSATIDVVDLSNGTDGELITWNSSGVAATVAAGTATHVLTSNGVGTAPTFQAIAAGGDVSKVGTPVNDQLGVWTGDGTIEGVAGLTYDGVNLTASGTITGSVTGNAGTVTTIAGLAPDTATTAAAQPNITSLGTIAALVTTDATVNESIGFDAINTVTYSSGTTTVDWSTGNVATMTFGAGNITTFAFTDPASVGQTVKLKMIQDGTGSRVVTAWDADIQWVGGGTAPTLSTGIAAEDWVTCIFTNTGAGNRYDCAASLDFQ